MKKKCKIGDKVPEFKIPLSNGNFLETKNLKGKKYILYFYPKDNTLAVQIRQKISVLKLVN